MSDGKSYWQNLITGTGQALPVAVIGALMAFGTLMVNVQIQLSELRLKQDQTLQILEAFDGLCYLDEGSRHSGLGHIVRLVLQKPKQ